MLESKISNLMHFNVGISESTFLLQQKLWLWK